MWVDDERLLDAVTALSGSGPAYVFWFIEQLAAAGVELGLPAPVSQQLALETVLGAAKLAAQSKEPPAVLRERVTSPNGTTARALDIFREGGIESLVRRAVQGARDRATELGDSLGNQ